MTRLTKKIIKPIALGLVISLIAVSCKKDKDEDLTPTTTNTPPSYTIPTTYNFDSVNFTTSTQRIAMLDELIAYIKTTHSNTVAPILDAQKLKDMYANVKNLFTNATLNTSGIQLKNKTGNDFYARAEFEANFDDAATASTNASANPTTTTALNGYAGKLISGTKYILVDTAGVEYKEFIEKGMMGAVLYYQATSILNTISTFNNTVVTGGTTAQERAWDEAFGYFGVPIDFPTNVTGLKNWGSYCNSVNTAIGSNATIMNAWLIGRAAISNKKDADRDAARDIVVTTWEKIVAAKFITYAKGAKTNFTAPATYHHNLSEAIGFIRAFKYNSAKTISDADINTLLGYFKSNGATINFYTLNTSDLDNAINKMAAVFGLNASSL